MLLSLSHFYLSLPYYVSLMNEFTLLIEEWQTDILLLELDLRHAAPQASAERRRVQRALQQARQAQVLLYSLAQVHTGTAGLAA